MELLIFAGIFLIGFAASVLNATVGGGGLLTIPFLMLIGLPPHVAIATARFGDIGGIGGVLKYHKARKINWGLAARLVAISLTAGLIGANILIALPEDAVRTSVAIIMLIFIPIILLKKSLGVERSARSQGMIVAGYVAYFLAVLYGATFSAGAGTLIGYTMIFFFGLPIIDAKGATMVAWVSQVILTSLIFLSQDLVHLAFGAVLIVSNFAGNYAGAHLAVIKGNAWVKNLFVLIVLISAIKLLF